MADVLKRTIRGRVLLTRDGRDLYDQEYYSEDETYYESTHQRVVLATNMGSPQEIDLSGVSSSPGASSTHKAAALFLQTDRAVKVAIDDNTKLWPLDDDGAVMLVGSFSHLYVQNESTTNQAIVELIATDKDRS